MQKIRKCIGAIALLLQISSFAVAQVNYPFRDTTLSHHERIKDLLSRLNVSEKISLLRATSPAIPRLGIDKYYHGNEALHGVVRPGKFTVFPQAIGLASMWNPDFLQEVSTAISDEARGRWNELNQGKDQTAGASDLLTFWSPTINMARDPRWGRTPETYGEDPFLTGTLGTAFVRGLQGNDPKYIKVVSTPKHFAANNKETNRKHSDSRVSERALREIYLKQFEIIVKESDPWTIMSSYNVINGHRASENKELLEDILRGEWGFRGMVTTDWWTRGEHYKEIKAGNDVKMATGYPERVKKAIELGELTRADLEHCARRVLELILKID